MQLEQFAIVGAIYIFPYQQYMNEFSCELANSINQLTYSRARLKAWSEVFELFSEEDREELYVEVINDIATVSMILPRAIKDRFIFAGVHLCHQANMIAMDTAWKDNLPADRNIRRQHLDEFGNRWAASKYFGEAIDEISNEKTEPKTHNFRDLFHHRTPVRIMFGVTQLITRQRSDSQVRYQIGGTPPLSLQDVIAAIDSQIQPCYSAFEAFQNLVWEQEAAIIAAIS